MPSPSGGRSFPRGGGARRPGAGRPTRAVKNAATRRQLCITRRQRPTGKGPVSRAVAIAVRAGKLGAMRADGSGSERRETAPPTGPLRLTARAVLIAYERTKSPINRGVQRSPTFSSRAARGFPAVARCAARAGGSRSRQPTARPSRSEARSRASRRGSRGTDLHDHREPAASLEPPHVPRGRGGSRGGHVALRGAARALHNPRTRPARAATVRAGRGARGVRSRP